jgi:hypothetical protein
VTGYRWLGEPPPMAAPTLVVMLTGWIDASGAAAEAMVSLEAEVSASPLAAFDDDVYVDFRARRPLMEIRDGRNAHLAWNVQQLSFGRERGGRDVLLLTGPEPDMAWRRFANEVADIADHLGVTRMVGLGAYPFATPHTRPPRISCTSPSQDVLDSAPFQKSSVDVPAGMVAVLEQTLAERGVPTIGLWAQVPHYVASMSYPASSVALLDALAQFADITVEAAEIRREAIIQRERLDRLVAGNAEHQAMVEQLEVLYDTDSSRPSAGELEIRSGEEIAAEFERFLREQD